MPRSAKSPSEPQEVQQVQEAAPDEEPRAEKPEPIGSVLRELTRPDGTTVKVEVPVYPPFSLADSRPPRRPARDRTAPSLKRKRSGGKPSSNAS